MRVHILAKREFDKLMQVNDITDENVEKFDSMIFISIVDTLCETNHFEKDHNNCITLKFDDVENDLEPSPTQIFSTKAFTKDQAKKLFDFIKANRDKEKCVVHCMAGISRSGAVGTFINGYAKGDWELFMRTNRNIMPNGRVHRMLNEAKYNDYENES